jgi:hypothetical protein|nr:MAG TPA: hypothetical protein [Crassvirales sp.]
MPEFIDISQLSKKSAASGNEEFQVSATEKITAQQIANLAPTSGDPQDATISKYSNTGTFVLPTEVASNNSIVEAIMALAVLAGENDGHRIKNFTSYIDSDSNYPINVTIFEVIDGKTAGVYFGPSKIGFGIFNSKNFDQTITVADNDIIAYTNLKNAGFWTKEINVADIGGGASDPLSAKMTSWTELTSGFGYNITTTDTLLQAIQKIWGHLSGGLVRVIHGEHMLGMAGYNPGEDSSTGFVVNTDSYDITIIQWGQISTNEFMNFTDEQLTAYIYDNGVTYYLDKLSNVIAHQKSLYVLSGSNGTVSWNSKYKVSSQQITLGLPSANVSSHNCSDTIEIWSSGGTNIDLSSPGGTLLYIREGDQTQPAGTLYKKTTITNPFDYYYYITVDYFKDNY